MRRVLHMLVVSLVVFGVSVAGVAAQEATPASDGSLLADLGYPEIRVTSDGTTHDFPAEVEAGRYHVVLENTSDLEVDLEFFQLPEGVTMEDFVAFIEETSESPEFVLPDYFYDVVFNGGPIALPGETSGVVLDLTPGEWVVNHVTYNLETEDPGTNTPTAITVTGEMPELPEPEGTEIGLIEMDFTVPGTLEAGPQIWKVVNNGLQIHHIIMLGVPDGTTEDDIMELVMLFEGPPASPEAGASPAAPAINPEEITDEFYTLLFSNGQFNLYEVDLEPGTYAMICFMPDPSGTPHVMLGMIEIVVVE